MCQLVKSWAFMINIYLIAKLDMLFRLIPAVLVFVTGYWGPLDLSFQAHINPRPREVGFIIAYSV
jgi:hypothetical protein